MLPLIWHLNSISSVTGAMPYFCHSELMCSFKSS